MFGSTDDALRPVDLRPKWPVALEAADDALLRKSPTLRLSFRR
jgi:hypothetical protein